jgi:hypothetical protein
MLVQIVALDRRRAIGGGELQIGQAEERSVAFAFQQQGVRWR